MVRVSKWYTQHFFESMYPYLSTRSSCHPEVSSPFDCVLFAVISALLVSWLVLCFWNFRISSLKSYRTPWCTHHVPQYFEEVEEYARSLLRISFLCSLHFPWSNAMMPYLRSSAKREFSIHIRVSRTVRVSSRALVLEQISHSLNKWLNWHSHTSRLKFMSKRGDILALRAQILRTSQCCVKYFVHLGRQDSISVHGITWRFLCDL